METHEPQADLCVPYSAGGPASFDMICAIHDDYNIDQGVCKTKAMDLMLMMLRLYMPLTTSFANMHSLLSP